MSSYTIMIHRIIIGAILVSGFLMSSCRDIEKSSDPQVDTSLKDIDLDSYSLENLLQQAENFTIQQNYEQAAAILERAKRKDSSEVMILHALADAYLDGLQSRKALETMEQAAILFPDSIQTLLKLSEYQLILKRYQSAIQTLNAIHEKKPTNAEAHFMKGMVRKELADTSGAMLEFQYATRENPLLIDAWINAGQLADGLPNQNPADYYRAGLRVDPNNLALLGVMASYLAQSGDQQGSIATYRRMIEIDSDHSKAYYDLGLLYLDLDSLKKSNDHFNMAVQTEPLFARAYFYRGLTQELLGNLQGAVRDYEQTLKLTPEDKDAQEGRKRITEQ